MISFLLQKKKEEKTILVCLISGHAVTGSVVKIFTQPGSVAQPIVLYSTEVYLRPTVANGTNILLDNTQEALRQVVKQCRKHTPKYDEVTCCLGEPWIISSNRTAHFSKRDPFVINDKLISDLVARETKLFEQEMARTPQSIGQGLLEIAEPVVDVNGYRIRKEDYFSIKGKNELVGRTVDVHLTFTNSYDVIIERVIDVIVDAFHSDQVTFTSFDSAKMKLLDKHDQGTVIDLGGCALSCMMVNNYAPSIFAVIPVGMHQLEKALCEQFDIPREKLDGVFAFAHDENVISHERDIYHVRILHAYNQFASSLPFHIAQIKKYIHTFPNPVVVIGRSWWIPFLAGALRNDIGAQVIIPSQDLFSQELIIPQTVSVMHIPLALAIIHSVSQVR